MINSDLKFLDRAHILATVVVAARRGRKLNMSSLHYILYILKSSLVRTDSKLEQYRKLDIGSYKDLNLSLLRMENNELIQRDVATDGTPRYIATPKARDVVAEWKTKYNLEVLKKLEEIFSKFPAEKDLRESYFENIKMGVAL